jgi:hypothetical protein
MVVDSRNIALYIDPPSPHFLGDQLFNMDSARFNGDRLNAPYIYLRDFLTARGIGVHTIDYLPKEKTGNVQNLYVSTGNLANYRRLTKRGDTVLSGFFAMECPIVEPSLYRALNRVQWYFKRIFSWSDSPSLERFVGGPLRCEPFRWPQSFDEVHGAIWSNSDRKFLVIINANKLPRLYWQELYTERLRAVEYFSRTEEIDLYGMGWDGPPNRVGKTWVPYTFLRAHRALLHFLQHFHPDPLLEAARRVYRGPARSKAETLGKYSFALCFENAILKGWITEKIFDCFFAGTIPIYWGAPDIDSYVPQECFIDMRRFADYGELRSYLKSLSPRDIQEYKENARAYLKSPQFRLFTKEAFTELFVRMIEEDTGISIT